MKKHQHYLLIPLAAFIGALIFFNLFARVEFRMEAFHVSLAMRLSHDGYTILRVPPVGVVKAKTQNTPVNIYITLENIELDKLKIFLAEGSEQDKLISEAKGVLNKALVRFVVITLLLGIAGGVFGQVVIQRRSIKEFAAGGLVGLIVVSVLLYGTYISFETKNFQNPEYEGMIKAAPWMINLVQDSFSTVNIWGKQLRGIANNLYGLFQRVESLQAIAPGDGELKILHVSDIHNNPAAYEFIDQVVKTFGVDFIIDSGDMSDLGTPLENATLEKVRKLKVPYVFTPGNHETMSIIRDLKKIPNVILLEGAVKQVKGIKIAGIEDPSLQNNDYHVSNRQNLSKYSKELQDIIRSSRISPDIVVAHNPEIVSDFWGHIPVVLNGHDHRYQIKVRPNSILIDAGTSGASGIGAFKTTNEIPYSFVLLHFDRLDSGVRLKYTDTIRISNMQSGYSLERKVFQNR
jgi:predicted MPP superfamily phosphohydrolase